MLSKIEKGHEDYDLVCPSDYIIERMLNEGLLLPLDFASIPEEINYIDVPAGDLANIQCDGYRADTTVGILIE